jgi:macrolide phosphotransferase
MARSPLTLAALATAAVPDLVVTGSGPLGHGDDDRDVVVRVAAHQQAQTEQSIELLALQAMTAGIRSRLPFQVPQVLGQTQASGVRAVVYDFLPGYSVAVDKIPAGDGVATSMGAALAAIHSLPGGFVAEVGLPHLSAAEARDEARNVIERAASTRLLPAAVRTRWSQAIDDDDLWQFQPTVINGNVDAGSFLFTDYEVGPVVSGVVGWGALMVGDPARDLHWLSAAGEAGESVLAAYRASTTRHADGHLRQRSLLHAELELARWLLHGVDTHDEGVVEEAVALLDGLVEHVLNDSMNPLSHDTGEVLSQEDVEELLSRTPPAAAPGNQGFSLETDSYENFDLDALEHGDGRGSDRGSDAGSTDEGPDAEGSVPDGSDAHSSDRDGESIDPFADDDESADSSRAERDARTLLASRDYTETGPIETVRTAGRDTDTDSGSGSGSGSGSDRH